MTHRITRKRSTATRKLTERPSPCNLDRFTSRAFGDEDFQRSLCRCCGKRIAMNDEFRRTRDTNDLDGYCRWCELGHPKRVAIERPRLFA